MSGGSFDYLYCKDVEQIMECESQLQEMEHELLKLGYQDLADRTKVICKEVQEFKIHMQQKLDNIQKVWHAVEWFCSGDCSEEEVTKVVKDFRLYNQQREEKSKC